MRSVKPCQRRSKEYWKKILNSSYFIRAGYSANADIVLDRKDKVLAINESLLQFESETAFVEVETAPQQYEKKYIKLGLSDGINIEVISGLTAKDKIKIWNKPLNRKAQGNLERWTLNL